MEFEQESIKDLIEKYIDCKSEKEKEKLESNIMLKYIPLVHSIARGFARRSTDPIEDLIQIGSIGLVKAIRFFDIKRNVSFKTYATYHISGEILHYIRDKANMLKVPREILQLSFRINKVTQQLKQELGHDPTPDEIAEKLCVPIDKIDEVMVNDRRKNIVSLDSMINSGSDSDGLLVIDQIADEKSLEVLNSSDSKVILFKAMELLEKDEKEIVKSLYFEGFSQSDIAKKLNISKMQVSRKHKRAIEKLAKIVKIC